ncbi:hypothetical protein GCM10025778_14310 [Paeniglutamicibacter antarcticus]|uniref:Uncharacterized protein n=1 Tax=Paeniglutamicibacter antarcticus TaxID=494023 RepID=A0ABP9TM02_9MICC
MLSSTGTCGDDPDAAIAGFGSNTRTGEASSGKTLFWLRELERPLIGMVTLRAKRSTGWDFKRS